jgi:photosystem II stability/assembly factor-like uncharacterized protein
MKKHIIALIINILSVTAVFAQNGFTSVTVDTLLTNNISTRAILVHDNNVWYGGSDGRMGYVDLTIGSTFEKRIVFNEMKPEFRSIAQTSGAVFVLNAGSPALLYKMEKGDTRARLVYQEKDEKAFYDSMAFWNDREGIAVGDPTGNCFSILVTRDGGENWSKLPCEQLQKTADGEAAFAASNTNIAIKGNNVWIVSGGSKARVFFSPDKGVSWQAYDTPIVQGIPMSGIFTSDFWDESTGFIAGGNYEQPLANSQNKAVTEDGGKTWNLIADGSGFGYASCIRYVPGSGGKKLVCVGASGLMHSADGGHTWVKLLDDDKLFTIRFTDGVTAIAAGQGKIVRLRFQ